MILEWQAPSITRFTEVDQDGFVGFQPSYFGTDEKQGGGPSLLALHPFGFQSRPRDPDVDAEGNPSNGAPLFVAYFGDRGYALPLFDPRNANQPNLPMPDKGGSVLAADVGSGNFSTIVLSGDNGNVTITVPTGALIAIKAPNGRSLTASATGVDIVGITNAGVVTDDDPGTAPSAVTIAAALTSLLNTLNTWMLLVDPVILSVLATTTPAVIPAYNAVVIARNNAMNAIASPYPTGMVATRLFAR